MSNIFEKQNIFLVEEQLENKGQLFQLIAKKASELGYVLSEEACYLGVLERENQQTTGFQDGFAIPHCKSKTVKEPKLLVFKTLPIPWDSLDGQDIVFSFVLLIPEQSAKEHLQVLAKIAKSLIDDEYRQQLKVADEQSIYLQVRKKLEV
ncbi:MAG: fructose PTS transporter subunit IIA [Bacillus sp. (in: Bacteria)]|nr:fructose PTS transporter subunit IIA [Bacillus sp. (in: firmicutes)]